MSQVSESDQASWVVRWLRAAFPYGHADFIPMCLQEMALHSDKNHDYAGPGRNPLGNFYRRAAIYALYPGLDLSDPAVVAVVDALKQLDAYLWFKSNKHTAKVEGLESRLRDGSVYLKLAAILEREAANERGRGVQEEKVEETTSNQGGNTTGDSGVAAGDAGPDEVSADPPFYPGGTAD